jgi:hypothetical protein
VAQTRASRWWRRLAPAVVVVAVGGATAGIQMTSASSIRVAAQALEAPDEPEDYLARGITTLLAPGTVPGDPESGLPDQSVAISADGRFVVVDTVAALIDEEPGGSPDDNGLSDIYLIDRDPDAGTDTDRGYDEPEEVGITLVTLGFEQGSEPGRDPSNGDSYDPDISADGRFVVFASEATNLRPDSADDANDPDIYRWDRLAAPDTPPIWVSQRAPSAFGGFERSDEPTVSDNGARVAFRHDCQSGVSLRAFAVPPECAFDSILVQNIPLVADPEMVPLEDDPGNPVDLVCQFHESPVLTGNGASVFFVVRGSESVFDCQEAFEFHIARFDLANPAVLSPLTATYRGVTLGLPPEDDRFDSAPISELSVSRDGRFLAFSAELAGVDSVPNDPVLDDQMEVFVRDQAAAPGTDVELVSRVGDEPGVCTGECASSHRPSISDDGRYVAYLTDAENILQVDFAADAQVVVRDRQNAAAENELVSVGTPVDFGSGPPPGNPEDFLGFSDSFAPAVSSHPPGSGAPTGLPFVAFVSAAFNLDEATQPINFEEDLYVRSFTSARLTVPVTGFDFGASPVGVGGNIQSIPFTAAPTGFGPLVVTSAVFEIPSAFSITAVPQCPAVNPGGPPCLVSVQFLPILLGPASPGVLTLTFDTNPLIDESLIGPEPPPTDLLETSISVRGVGVAAAPTLVFNPTSIAFGTATIGIGTPARPVTASVTAGDLFSVGFADIRVTGPGAADYRIDASQCLLQGARPSAPCQVLVTFIPTAIGARPAFLEFVTSPGTPPRIISLTGTGAQPTITLNPAVVHSGGVVGVRGDQWPPGEEVVLSIPNRPGEIRLIVRPDGTVELPAVIFHSRSFGPREVTAEVADNPAIRLAQPEILLVQAPGAHVVDIIGRK